MQQPSTSIKLNTQLKLNGYLKLLLSVILFALLAMLVIQISSGSHHFGFRSDRIVEVLEYNFVAFFSTFKENSINYMFFVSIIMLINLVSISVVRSLKLSNPHLINIVIFIASIFIAYKLPHAELYYRYFADHKLSQIILCLVMVTVIPYPVGINLGWDRISQMILGKLVCIIVYGLLLVQMIIEI